MGHHGRPGRNSTLGLGIGLSPRTAVLLGMDVQLIVLMEVSPENKDPSTSATSAVEEWLPAWATVARLRTHVVRL
ncbi:unnamed protein product [Arctogadus glacialis]